MPGSSQSAELPFYFQLIFQGKDHQTAESKHAAGPVSDKANEGETQFDFEPAGVSRRVSEIHEEERGFPGLGVSSEELGVISGAEAV